MAGVNETTEPCTCPVDLYCVGMCSWTGCPGNTDMATFWPHPESALSLLPTNDADAKLNVNEPHPSSTGRFALMSDQEIAKLSEGLMPQNTAKMKSCTLKNFHDWMKNRNPTDPVPDDILQCVDPVLLNNQPTGEHYPLVTLHQLLCGILRHMRSYSPATPNFLDKKDNSFKHLLGTLDSYFHNLHSEGHGRRTKHAETIGGLTLEGRCDWCGYTYWFAKCSLLRCGKDVLSVRRSRT